MRIRLEFKLADMWIGVFWKRERTTLHTWVCIVPCLPIHIMVNRPSEMEAPGTRDTLPVIDEGRKIPDFSADVPDN